MDALRFLEVLISNAGHIEFLAKEADSVQVWCTMCRSARWIHNDLASVLTFYRPHMHQLTIPGE